MTGAELIAAERVRQVSVEGWTAEHDDTHTDGSLADAAAYIAATAEAEHFDNARDRESPYICWNRKTIYWPWDNGLSLRDRLDELVKAGALIAAEIDRLQRDAS